MCDVRVLSCCTWIRMGWWSTPLHRWLHLEGGLCPWHHFTLCRGPAVLGPLPFSHDDTHNHQQCHPPANSPARPPHSTPTARLRHLRELELSSASPPCLDGGLLGLCFLPHLTSLAIGLDIPPAFPQALADLPTGLQQLRLAAMWLEEMPTQLAECAGG